MACLCLLFGYGGQEYYQQVFDLLGNQGLDALFDNVAVKMGDSQREISEALLLKKRFKKTLCGNRGGA